MQIRKIAVGMITIGLLMVMGAILMLWQTAPANAQCGTQASSCKNCHEVQAKKPVNKDGTGWHQSHAFGDFCANCHAGNVQSMVVEEAHQGMVAPLSDVQAGCGSCHPNDLADRAKVYADKLGVKVGVGAGAAAAGTTSGASEATPASGETAQPASAQESKPVENPKESQPAGGALVTSGQDVIDYNKRYEETAGGKTPINWGDIILVVLILGMLAGGGGFVFWNERRLRGVAAKSVEKTNAVNLPEIKDIPPEIVAMLPQLAGLNPMGKRALAHLLENPDEASELLYSLAQLDPELLRRIRNLDGRARALLMALAGQ